MIKKLSTAHIDSVMAIWLNSNIRAHHFIAESYWHRHFDMVKEMLPAAKVYVYEESGAICGFVGLVEDSIEGIFVDSPYQSKGIGRTLLDYVKLNRNGLSLHVYEKNARAAAFYLREGFVVTEKQIDENTGERELVMHWTRR